MKKPAYERRSDWWLAAPLAVYLVGIFALIAGLFFSITAAAVKEALGDALVWHAVYLSVATSFVSTVISVAIALPSGYILSRREFPGALAIDTLLDLPIVLPPLVLGLSVLVAFSTSAGRFVNDHVIEFIYTWKGIILVQVLVGCSFATRAVKAGYDAFDVRYEEVAMTLGAGRWQAFSKVALPNITPSILAGTVISWARIFGLFGPVLMVAGTMRGRTEIMPTTVFLEVSIGRLEVALVIGAMMTLFSMATLVAFKKLGGKGYLW